MKQVDFEGVIHQFPDDFSNEEISSSLDAQTSVPSKGGIFNAASMLVDKVPVLKRALQGPKEILDTLRGSPQYAGASIEAGLSPPALLGGLGLATAGPPGLLGGLAIGTVGEIPALLTGRQDLSPSHNITQKLREWGVTPEPDPERGFGRKVASYVGAAAPMTRTVNATVQAGLAGLGGATGSELSGGNPLVEFAGSLIPGGVQLGYQASKYLRPTNELIRRTKINDTLKQQGREQLIAEGKALQDEFGGQLSASERGLGHGTRAAENELAGHLPVLTAARRESNTLNFIDKLKSMIGITSSEEAAKQLTGKSLEKIQSLKSNRVPEFEAALEQASNVEGKTPSIDVTSVKKGIVEEIISISRSVPIGEGSKETISYLKSQLQKLNEATAPIKQNIDLQNIDLKKLKQPIVNRNINIRGAQDLLHDYTVDAKATGGMLTDVAKAAQKRGANIMKTLMSENIDNLAQSGNEAASILSGARSKYADVMSGLAEVGSTPLGSVIEKATKKGGPITVKDVQSSWKRSTPEQREIITRLIGNDKEIAKSLQSAWLDDILEKSTTPGISEIGESSISLRRFLNEWKIDKNFRDTFSGDNEKLSKLIRARSYLDRIVPRGAEKATQGPIGQIGTEAQLAVGSLNPAGQTKIFLGGFIAKRMYPKIYNELLTTDKGIDALMKISQPSRFKTSEVEAAAIFINTIFNVENQ